MSRAGKAVLAVAVALGALAGHWAFSRQASNRLAAAHADLARALERVAVGTGLDPGRPRADAPDGVPAAAALVRGAAHAVVPERDRGLQVALQALRDVPAVEWTERDRDLARRWLDGQGAAFALTANLSAPPPVPSGAWGDGLSRESLGILRLALVVGLDARLALADGDIVRQAQGIGVLLAIARSLCAEPSALALTLGTGVERMALADVRDVLASGRWEAESSADLQALVDRDPCAGAVEATYRVESERLAKRATAPAPEDAGPLLAHLHRPWVTLRRARVLEARRLELEHLDEPYPELLRRHDRAFRGAGDGSLVELVDIAGTARAVETARRLAVLSLELAAGWPGERVEGTAAEPTPYTGETPTIERRDGALEVTLPESRRYFSQYEEDAPRTRADALFVWRISPPEPAHD